MAERVQIVETVRDAWQGLPHKIPTDEKEAFVRRLVTAGFEHIDVGSFVSPRKVPTKADTDELFARLADLCGTHFVALVASERGLDRLLSAPCVDEVLFPFSLSPSFQRRNTGHGREEAFELLCRLTERAHVHERLVYVTVSMAFGNNEGDPHDPAELHDWIERLHHDARVDRVSLADTTAVATPRSIGTVYEALMEAGDWPVPGAHLHVTPEGQEAMVDAALDAGCRYFDCALGGLGGCQFAKGAVSNVSTWPLVRQLHARGFETGLPEEPLEALDREARTLARRG